MAPARQFSARLDSVVIDRLEERARRGDLNRSRLAERYIDEGMRMEEHPGIVFRDGVTGRRAGLVRGPDVWEIIAAIRSCGLDGDEALEAVAEFADLTPSRMRTAIRYYAAFQDEIDERVDRNLAMADAAEAQWRREQNLLR
jgi:uncharacterized protein (DUF433 family)